MKCPGKMIIIIIMVPFKKLKRGFFSTQFGQSLAISLALTRSCASAYMLWVKRAHLHNQTNSNNNHNVSQRATHMGIVCI